SGAFAYQFIVGAALPISNVPGLSLTAEYRFLGTLGHRMNGVYTHKSAPLWDPDSGWTQELDVDRFKVDVDNLNHSLLVGLRYVFNAAPTVASVVPVAASRSYVVFFDWGRSDLTDRARQVIGEAATSRGSSVTRIEVNGFTDRSGPTDYNMQLSIRRANAVAAELVRRGVPRNEIVTRGFGEEGNLVSTADGVREPQNRRVEIVLK
ncbi:MAG: OmpA family protein, partial [Roseomonas sp.]|nr:OmpA family protein [Roseomonas sp.]